MSFNEITFEFDERKFRGQNWGNMPALSVAFFYLAYRARRGDEAAIAVLNAAQITIRDVDGVDYWPAR